MLQIDDRPQTDDVDDRLLTVDTEPPQLFDGGDLEVAESGPARWRHRVGAPVAVAALSVQAVAVLALSSRLITRPFGFDEQWRAAWVDLGPDIAGRLHDVPGPMTAGWVGLEWLTLQVLPNTEWALRLPMLAAFVFLGVATFWLARRWVGDLAAYLTASLMLLNGPLLVYGVLLKPFVFDAFCAVMMLIGWRWAQGRRPRARAVAYVGLGLATVFASSAIFVLGPLVAYDIASAWRRRRLRPWRWLVPDAAALLIAAAHLWFFLGKQDRLLREGQLYPSARPYWQDYFVPHGPLGEAAGFIVDRIRPVATLLTASYLPPDDTDKYLIGSVPPSPPSLVVATLAIAFSALLVWGIWRAWHRTSQRILVVVLFGTLAGSLAASFLGAWPFGMVRANLLLVPMLYLLAGIGATDLARTARSMWRRGRIPRRVIAATLAVTVVSVIAIAVPTEMATLQAVNDRHSAPQFVDRTRDVVRLVHRVAAADGVAVIVLNPDGWHYYADLHEDSRNDEGVRPRPDRVLLTNHPGDRAIVSFLTRHGDAERVVVYNLTGLVPEDHLRQDQWLFGRGYCPSRRWDFPQTGIIVEYHRTHHVARCPMPTMQQVRALD